MPAALEPRRRRPVLALGVREAAHHPVQISQRLGREYQQGICIDSGRQSSRACRIRRSAWFTRPGPSPRRRSARRAWPGTTGPGTSDQRLALRRRPCRPGTRRRACWRMSFCPARRRASASTVRPHRAEGPCRSMIQIPVPRRDVRSSRRPVPQHGVHARLEDLPNQSRDRARGRTERSRSMLRPGPGGGERVVEAGPREAPVAADQRRRRCLLPLDQRSNASLPSGRRSSRIVALGALERRRCRCGPRRPSLPSALCPTGPIAAAAANGS